MLYTKQMTTKSYAEVEKSFNLKYLLKSKQKGFSQKQSDFFNRIPVDVLARSLLSEQVKMVDYVTKNTVDTCALVQVRQHYIQNVRPTLRFRPTNQADLGNIAYILLKLDDPNLTDEWTRYLSARYSVE